jgi:hypothetical protein
MKILARKDFFYGCLQFSFVQMAVNIKTVVFGDVIQCNMVTKLQSNSSIIMVAILVTFQKNAVFVHFLVLKFV